MGQESAFVQGVVRAPSERAIALALMDMGQQLTGATAVGFYSMLSPNVPSEIHIRGISDEIIDAYEQGGRAIDPVLRSVTAHHVPAAIDIDHFAATSPEYREFIKDRDTLGHRQYMLAPVIARGAIVGMMHFASRSERPFSSEVLRVATAMSLHVSTRVAVLRAFDSFSSTWDGALTRRELEVAALAVRGHSISIIARDAGVSPNTIKKHLKTLYAKLGVASRSELGALLVRGPSFLDKSPSWAVPVPRRLSGGALAFAHSEH
jgi:DNA-binding NarL/FixJ family response regulator